MPVLAPRPARRVTTPSAMPSPFVHLERRAQLVFVRAGEAPVFERSMYTGLLEYPQTCTQLGRSSAPMPSLGQSKARGGCGCPPLSLASSSGFLARKLDPSLDSLARWSAFGPHCP